MWFYLLFSRKFFTQLLTLAFYTKNPSPVSGATFSMDADYISGFCTSTIRFIQN